MTCTKQRVRYLNGCGTHAWWNSIDVYYTQPTPGDALKPILLFIGGGGWQGVDHVNSHDKLMESVVAQGYVAVAVRHRPATVHLGGILSLASVAIIALYWLLGLAAALTALALLCSLIPMLNATRRSVPFASVVHDVAVAIAHVYHVLDCASLGGDRHQLVLCGNSSGGHLFLMIAVDSRWLDRLAVPTHSVVAVVDVSGVISLNDLPAKWLLLPPLLGFDPSAWRDLSPLYVAEQRGVGCVCRYILATTVIELPTIRAASRRLSEVLTSQLCPVTSVRLRGRGASLLPSHHFTGVRCMRPLLASLARDLRSQARSLPPVDRRLTGSGGAAPAGLDECQLVPMHKADMVFLLAGFTVGAVMTLRSPLDEEELRDIAHACAGGAAVMRACPVRFGAKSFWAPHLAFDAAARVGRRRVEALEAAVAAEAAAPLAAGEVAWRLTQLEAADATALVLTFHHCLGDGAWLHALLERATSRRLTARRPPAAPGGRVAPRPSGGVPLSLAYNAVAWVLQLRAAVTASQLPLARGAPPRVFRSAVMHTGAPTLASIRRHEGWRGERPTVTEVMLAALAGCLRASLEEGAGVPPRRAVLAFMPVMQPHGRQGAEEAPLHGHQGNAVSGYFIELPCHLEDAAARLHAVQRQTAPKRYWLVAPFHALLIRAALPFVPCAFLPALVLRVSSGLSCVGVSSFRGPADGSILGLDVREFYYFGFFEPARMPLMLGISSVADRLVISLVAMCDSLGPGGADAMLKLLPNQLLELEQATLPVGERHRG
ncbi:hypothetical protein AB1Y20_006131 [Prymnesium parvum]|uniref:Diacylglycerol O-acyltransferase n=1 Tax=Prymnesium parvum TaxID=97485 RepID=A0AB34J4A0_PRYPA